MSLRHRRDPEPEPEPDLGPTREDLENGFEPADAWPPPDPNPWLTPEQEAYQQAQAQDALDAAWADLQAWRKEQAADLAAARQPEPEPDPELEAG